MRTDPSPELLCFTDVLCGYCYLADARLAELAAELGGEVQISHHFMSVYGDVRRRIERSGKSGRAYATMVRGLLARHDHVEVHPALFEREIPTSSVPAHLYLRAVKLLEDDGVIDAGQGPSPFERLLVEIRLAFFRDGKDVSQRAVLDGLARELGIPCDQVSRVIDDGRAFAELAHDSALAREHKVAVTPTLVLGEDAELLSGDLGSADLEARLRERLGGRASAAGGR